MGYTSLYSIFISSSFSNTLLSSKINPSRRSHNHSSSLLRWPSQPCKNISRLVSISPSSLSDWFSEEMNRALLERGPNVLASSYRISSVHRWIAVKPRYVVLPTPIYLSTVGITEIELRSSPAVEDRRGLVEEGTSFVLAGEMAGWCREAIAGLSCLGVLLEDTRVQGMCSVRGAVKGLLGLGCGFGCTREIKALEFTI